MRYRALYPGPNLYQKKLNPASGLYLARIKDASFDKGLITLDKQLRVVFSNCLRNQLTTDTIRYNFQHYEGKPITLPTATDRTRASSPIIGSLTSKRG